MSPELEQKLIKKYPVLFRDVNKSPRETLICFGAEFSDGWFKIFEDLCNYLTKLSKHKILLSLKNEFKTEENKGYIYVESPTISFTQAKEKYGLIRIYWTGNGIDNYEEIKQKLNNPEDLDDNIKKFYDRVDNAIDYVEFLSSKVCEDCGEPGKLYTNGWYMTKCKKHIIERYGFDPDEGEQKEF